MSESVVQCLKFSNHATDSVYSQDLPWRTPSSFNDRRPLVVQLSHFDYGGIAVSVCISHKIVDACVSLSSSMIMLL